MRRLLIKDTTLNNVKRLVILLFVFLTYNLVGAQDRMDPAKIYMDNPSRGYETSLFNYFNIAESDNFAFLVKPSFTGESCLTFDKKTNMLKLKRATRNIWYEQKWYDDRIFRRLTRKKIVPSKVFLLNISDSLSTSLHELFQSVVLTSSFGNVIPGLDGVTYKFILNPYSKVAECWTPPQGSNCGQAVSVIEELCNAVVNSDSEKAEKLISEVERVTSLFKQYYPEDFKEEYY